MKKKTEYDVLKPKSKFEGICYQPFPFQLEITTRNGSQIEGEITWPGIGGVKTKVRGKLEGIIIKIII